MQTKLLSLPVLALGAAVVYGLWQARQGSGVSGLAGHGRTWFGHHHGPRRGHRIYPSVPHGSQCFLTTAGWVRYDRLGIAYPCPMPIGFGAGLPVVTPFGQGSY